MAITPPPPTPVFGSATFNDDVLAVFAWLQLAVPQFNDLAILADGGIYQVQSNPTDATAGKLLKVGAGGLLASSGIAATNNDLNNVTVNGFFYADSAVSNAPFAGGNWVVLSLRRTQSVGTQIALSRRAAFPQAYWRIQDESTGWGEWQKILDSEDLSGTVSQSGGKPTGAIIERGSNANGEYVRFADGTQICTTVIGSAVGINANSAEGGVFVSSSPYTWNFPATFFAVPSVSGAARTSDTAWISGRPVSATQATAKIVSTTSLAARGFDLFAIGRWF